jgi:flagellar secretion chaperone FliS
MRTFFSSGSRGPQLSYNQALSAYRETRIRTASQGTLIVMLYDEAIKQMSAVAALFDEDFKKEPARIEKANTHILKSQEIITELMASLDMENGGEIARNLLALYTWFNQQLLEANMEKKADKILSVKNLMDQLRGAWIEVVSTTSAPQSRQNAPAGINIAG